MRKEFRVEMGYVGLLEFRGPDAVRFLNGQLTQDVKRLAGGEISLPSCVTDAKGKLQFRVYLTEKKEGVLWVSVEAESAEALEARLTRYLIADDVEVTDISGEYRLYHVVGREAKGGHGTLVRKASRFGIEGVDLWVPVDDAMEFPEGPDGIRDDELEAVRISNGAPAWGKELTEGMLPPEAGLEVTDISYHKGCYIGQEVISRIKSAGKVNRSLVKFTMAEEITPVAGDEIFSGEDSGGALTSVSPMASGGVREALGFVKRNADRGNLRVKVGDEFREISIAG